MQRKKKKKQESSNLKIAVVFCVLVCFLVVLSLFFKIITVYKSSKFDGVHSFNLVVYSEGKENPRRNEVISLVPEKESISVLEVLGNVKPSEVGKTLEVPIDGLMGVYNFTNNDLSKIGEKKGLETILEEAVFRKRNIKTNLSFIDMVRLWLFVRSVPNGEITFKELSMESNGLKITEDFIDKIASQLFSDNALFQEKLNIQIINGADVFGFGNRLARLVSNIGGNVVGVSTADNSFDNSEILYANGSYTLKRLNKILGFKLVKTKDYQTYDIIIKIGKDNLNSLTF